MEKIKCKTKRYIQYIFEPARYLMDFILSTEYIGSKRDESILKKALHIIIITFIITNIPISLKHHNMIFVTIIFLCLLVNILLNIMWVVFDKLVNKYIYIFSLIYIFGTIYDYVQNYKTIYITLNSTHSKYELRLRILLICVFAYIAFSILYRFKDDLSLKRDKIMSLFLKLLFIVLGMIISFSLFTSLISVAANKDIRADLMLGVNLYLYTALNYFLLLYFLFCLIACIKCVYYDEKYINIRYFFRNQYKLMMVLTLTITISVHILDSIISEDFRSSYLSNNISYNLIINIIKSFNIVFGFSYIFILSMKKYTSFIE